MHNGGHVLEEEWGALMIGFYVATDRRIGRIVVFLDPIHFLPSFNRSRGIFSLEDVDVLQQPHVINENFILEA